MAPVFFLPHIQIDSVSYYLFLPAGVKLFSMLIFRWRGLVGVGVGAFTRLVVTDPTQTLISWFIVAVSTNLIIYLLVILGLKLFKVERDLSNLQYYQIVTLATVTSIANGFVFAYGVSQLTIGQASGGILHNGFASVVANFIGNALFVCVAVLIVRHKITIMNFIAKLKTSSKINK